MLTLGIWWSGILLEPLILLRGFQTKAFAKYPFFFTYIACAFLGDVTNYVHLHLAGPASYHAWYWGRQIPTLIVGYGIMLEILKHILSPYPGAERFARIAGVTAFGAALCFALVYPALMPSWTPTGIAIQFERDLRAVQGIFLFVILAVVFYYALPVGRNMRGMVLGYGLYVTTSLVSLAIRSYAPGFDTAWNAIQPFSYFLSLVVWLIALWVYQPNPAPDPAIRLETDYESVVARTRGMMGAMRSYIGKAAQP